MGVCSFNKAFSWDISLWVMLGNFALKKGKVGKGNMYLTKNQLVETKLADAEDNHSWLICT